MTVRRRLFEALDPESRGTRGLSVLNKVIVGSIVVSIIATVLETEPALDGGLLLFLALTQSVVGVMFLVEYLARLWVCVEDARYAHPIVGRLRWAATPGALIDLAALSPLLIAALGTEPCLLRLARLVRVLRVLRLGRLLHAARTLGEAMASRRFEPAATFVVAGLLLLVTSSLLCVAEAEAQPEDFGSIPRAMRWSVATLTTVGYGDVAPVTTLGRVFASMTAVVGIGPIAMPTGILAAALSNALQAEREAEAARRRAREQARRRPHGEV